MGLNPKFVSQDIIDATAELVGQLDQVELNQLKRFEEEGYEAKAVAIVNFLDDNDQVRPAASVDADSRKWFSMPHVTLGYVLGIFDGGTLLNRKEIQHYVAKTFGPDAYSIH